MIVNCCKTKKETFLSPFFERTITFCDPAGNLEKANQVLKMFGHELAPVNSKELLMHTSDNK